MKSIQTKIIVLIMMVVILCSIVVGGIGIFHLKSMSEQNSAQIMNLSCREEGKKLGQTFHSIEQSVKIIENNSVMSMDMDKVLKSTTLRNRLIDDLRPIVLATANSTEGAVAIYIHFNQEYAPADTGIYFTKTVLKESFFEQPIAELSRMKAVELDTMDWYNRSIEEKKAVWLPPYNNERIGEKVISYVVPIYQGEMFVGIAGMDILFSDITEKIAEVNLYESGRAFLINDKNEVIYHPENKTYFPVTDLEKWTRFREESNEDVEGKSVFEYREFGRTYKLACYELDNDMHLLLSASKAEIEAGNNRMIKEVLASLVVIALICILVSILISQSIIRPLKDLTAASKKIAEGNLDIKVPSSTRDEVGELADSLQQTVDCLRAYMDRINDLAYTDPLTGVKSKAAYGEEVRKLEHTIRDGFYQFGIVMFDINGLKEMNDTYGHDAGDAYIRNACKLICMVYKHSPVFRMGGDEFIAVLKGQDLLYSQKLMYQFYERMEKISQAAEKPEEEISIAAGMAVFHEGKDTDVQSVFKRADENMYMNKKAMKAGKKPVLEVEKFEV